MKNPPLFNSMDTTLLTSEQITAAREELEKVFSMAVAGIDIEVFSEAIDAVWHEMLKDQAAYINYCINTFGHVIGHSKGAGHGIVSFIESYETRYGKLPWIWFVDKYGRFIKEEWDEYLHTGVVKASWNCQPDHSCERPPTKEVQPEKDQPSPQTTPEQTPSKPNKDNPSNFAETL